MIRVDDPASEKVRSRSLFLLFVSAKADIMPDRYNRLVSKDDKCLNTPHKVNIALSELSVLCQN